MAIFGTGGNGTDVHFLELKGTWPYRLDPDKYIDRKTDTQIQYR